MSFQGQAPCLNHSVSALTRTHIDTCSSTSQQHTPLTDGWRVFSVQGPYSPLHVLLPQLLFFFSLHARVLLYPIQDMLFNDSFLWIICLPNSSFPLHNIAKVGLKKLLCNTSLTELLLRDFGNYLDASSSKLICQVIYWNYKAKVQLKSIAFLIPCL